MELVQFGKTKLTVSRIGLGLAALGRPGYINIGHGSDLNADYDVEAMKAKASSVLHEAYQQGIRYFDVARSYGQGEYFLENWLHEIGKKDDVVVGSKWGYTYTAGWKVTADRHEVKEHSITRLNHQWPESVQLLKNNLCIYHIHSATLESGVLDNKEVLDKLWDLKKKGIVIGLSLSGERQSQTLEKAIAISRGEENLFQSVQATWNILEQSATESLKKASLHGFGVIIKEAVANGRLTERNTDPAFLKKKNTLKAISDKYKVGVDALSIAFIMRQPWVSTVLSGAATKDQLLSNLKAQYIRLTDSDMECLSEMREPASEYWKRRSRLIWN